MIFKYIKFVLYFLAAFLRISDLIFFLPISNGEAFKVIHISGLGFDNDSDKVVLSHISSQISNAIFIPSISIVNFLLPFEKYLFFRRIHHNLVSSFYHNN